MTSHETQARGGDLVETPEPGTSGRPAPTGWLRVVGLAVGLSLMVGVLVTAFAWPASESEPRDLPIAVVGPPEAVTQLEQQLDTAVPDGFDLTTAADPEAARDLITEREVYGAIVFDPADPPQVLTASAASPAVAQALQGIATELNQSTTGAPPPQVEDVVALPDDDPRGAGFAASALPMVLAGMLVGAAMTLLLNRVWRRVVGALLAAAGAGLVVGAVAQLWLGLLEGDYWVNSGVIALTTAAVSVALVGLDALLGRAGFGLGAALVLLLGNPLSGMATAPEMVPAGWGTLGQLLPPGAGGTLLRSTSFFDGAAAGGPLIVLASWLAAGLVLAAAGSVIRRR